MMKKRKRGSIAKKAREKAIQRHQESQGMGYLKIDRDVNIFEIDKEGIKKLDVIPYQVTSENHPEDIAQGDYWHQFIYFVHKDVGPDHKRIVCPYKTFERNGNPQPCPICEARATLQRSAEATNDEEVQEQIRRMKPSMRVLYNVIDRTDKESFSKGIQLMDMSYHLFGKLLDEEQRADEEMAYFMELEGGYTLKVRFRAKKFNNRVYYEASKIEFVKRKDYPESILKKSVPLDDCLQILPYDQISRIFMLDENPIEEEDFDSDKSSLKKKRKSKDEEFEEIPFDVDDDDDADDDDDDEDEDDEDIDDDDDEDEDDIDDEDEDDIDDDEEDDDEEVNRKRKKSSMKKQKRSRRR